MVLASNPGLPRSFFHSCEKKLHGRPGSEARWSSITYINTNTGMQHKQFASVPFGNYTFRLCHSIPTTAAPKPTAANVLQVLKGLSDSEWIGLGVHLHFPLDRDQFLSREKEDVVMLWLKLDPAPTWRRLISALDASSLYREDQSKVSIRQYAEPLTGMI